MVEYPRYFNRIFELVSYTKESNKRFDILVNQLKNSDAIYIVATGRSLYLNSAILRAYNEQEASKDKPVWKYVGDINVFPVGRPRDIIKLLNQGTLDSLLVLAISGSGNTPIVVESLKDLGINEKLNYFFITGNLEGKIYQYAKKYNIPVIYLATKSKESANKDIRKEGVMGDVFELTSSLLLYTAITSEPPEGFRNKLYRTIEEVDNYTTKLVESLITGDTIVGGFGAGESASLAFATRLEHLSPYTRRKVQQAGPLAQLSYGDNLVLITFSGSRNPFIQQWIDKARSRKARIYVITSDNNFNGGSNIGVIKLNAEDKTEFYEMVNFYLNYVIVRIIGELYNIGAKLSEDTLRWYHSIMG